MSVGFRFLVSIVSLSLIAPFGIACDIPVFRYALERWPSDAFRLTIVTERGLTRDEQQLVQWLNTQTVEGGGFANLSFQIASVDDIPDEVVPETLPGFVLQYPPNDGTQGVIVSGAFEQDVLSRVITSPLREGIATRLLDGQSGVWVMIESGNAQRDDALAQIIQAELDALEESLQLPTIEDRTENETVELSDPASELRIEFSLLRVSKSDPDEFAFVQMLLGSELDLVLYPNEPIVFPMYGQGRALYALVGNGINSDMIRKAGTFLVGPCSCIVKDDNPGTDMLFATDWSGRLMSQLVVDKAVPPPFAVPQEALADTVYAVTPVTLMQTEAEPGTYGSSMLLWILAGLGITSMIGVAFILVKSKQNLS